MYVCALFSCASAHSLLQTEHKYTHMCLTTAIAGGLHEVEHLYCYSFFVGLLLYILIFLGGIINIMSFCPKNDEIKALPLSFTYVFLILRYFCGINVEGDKWQRLKYNFDNGYFGLPNPHK